LRFLVTGGAGFIGSALVDRILKCGGNHVLNLDALTYAANPDAADFEAGGYEFVQADICDPAAVGAAIAGFRPDVILHLAAESHVDRSIDGPGKTLATNITGTFVLLQAALAYWQSLDKGAAQRFRFHHVSTDEVYGDLGPDEAPFSEATAYSPSSPYSASKAASDHLVRAWHRTYGLPTLVTSCSNNYGPRQFPEKLIPLMILSAIHGRPLPVYGDGKQVRDWLHVDDHADALYQIATRGKVGQTYNIGGRSELQNIEVVEIICQLLEEEHPDKPSGVERYSDLITTVTDRPGHDRRYAIDDRKLESELDVKPVHSFNSGLRETVRWYLDNQKWCEAIKADRHDGHRIGLSHNAKAAVS
jgi:dTDP-glucose 4,6-dehydratase